MKNPFILLPILAFILFLLGGCSRPDPQEDSSIKVVTYDGCQYLFLHAYPAPNYTLTHKGNCTNCITRMEKK